MSYMDIFKLYLDFKNTINFVLVPLMHHANVPNVDPATTLIILKAVTNLLSFIFLL